MDEIGSLETLSPKHTMAAAAVRDAIAGGKYAPGERLPGERILAAARGVAPRTMRASIPGRAWCGTWLRWRRLPRECC